MRQISISLEVFSQIWALRQNDEGSEDAIIARILAERRQGPGIYRELEKDQEGIRDFRHNVHFPEGFEIFRSFKGTDMRAVATGGRWRVPATGASFGSLNELSRGIGAGPESAWANWFFLGKDGGRRQIASLRDPGTVTRRPKAKRKAAPKRNVKAASAEVTWLDDVRAGLAAIEDSRGLLDDIYKAVESVRRAAGRSWPASAHDIIRRELEESCSESEAFRGEADLFTMPYGRGAGFWALR